MGLHKRLYDSVDVAIEILIFAYNISISPNDFLNQLYYSEKE
jgi:hypothetical protein